MTIAKTCTFRSGNSEAVRLPKDAAFGEGVELVVVRSGRCGDALPRRNIHPRVIARLEALPRPTSIEQRDNEELPDLQASDGGVPTRHQCRHPFARWRPPDHAEGGRHLRGAALIPIVSRVELEGRVYRESAHTPIRRARLEQRHFSLGDRYPGKDHFCHQCPLVALLGHPPALTNVHYRG